MKLAEINLIPKEEYQFQENKEVLYLGKIKDIQTFPDTMYMDDEPPQNWGKGKHWIYLDDDSQINDLVLVTTVCNSTPFLVGFGCNLQKYIDAKLKQLEENISSSEKEIQEHQEKIKENKKELEYYLDFKAEIWLNSPPEKEFTDSVKSIINGTFKSVKF